MARQVRDYDLLTQNEQAAIWPTVIFHRRIALGL